MDTQNAGLKSRPKSFNQRPKKFCRVSEDEENFIFQKGYFTSECFYGEVEIRLEDPNEKLLTKDWKIVAQTCTLVKKLHSFSKTLFSIKKFIWTCEMQFWKRHSFPLEENVNKFCSMSENDKIDYQNFQKKFINILLWIQKTNFRQAHWKLFGERPKSCCSGSGNDKKQTVFRELLFIIKIIGTDYCKFDNPVETFLTKSKTFSLGVRKWWKILFFFSKKFFHLKIPMDKKNSALTTLPINFWRKVKKSWHTLQRR